jgi:hypothetical protein
VHGLLSRESAISQARAWAELYGGYISIRDDDDTDGSSEECWEMVLAQRRKTHVCEALRLAYKSEGSWSKVARCCVTTVSTIKEWRDGHIPKKITPSLQRLFTHTEMTVDPADWQ